MLKLYKLISNYIKPILLFKLKKKNKRKFNNKNINKKYKNSNNSLLHISINKNCCIKMFANFYNIFITLLVSILENWIILKGKLLKKILMRMLIWTLLLQNLSTTLVVASRIKDLWLVKHCHLKKASLLKHFNWHYKKHLNKLVKMVTQFHSKRNKNVSTFQML